MKGSIHVAKGSFLSKRGEDEIRIVERRSQVVGNECFREMRRISNGRAIFNVTNNVRIASEKVALN